MKTWYAKIFSQYGNVAFRTMVMMHLEDNDHCTITSPVAFDVCSMIRCLPGIPSLDPGQNSSKQSQVIPTLGYDYEGRQVYYLLWPRCCGDPNQSPHEESVGSGARIGASSGQRMTSRSVAAGIRRVDNNMYRWTGKKTKRLYLWKMLNKLMDTPSTPS